MKPHIDGTRFGSITVDGTVFNHDVIIRPDGRVKKRKKKLSRAVYGTSHTISRQEARYVYKQAAGADRLIVGSGQDGNVTLSPEAAAYLKRKNCRVRLVPTPKVTNVWNRMKGTAVGLFHVTC
ncbi:MTH938/NDUFAF3 family protein [Dactylosporangium sp. NPDC049140]|uniref:Mth938-like domain-containing protein n=1 Tax=Dactylosporangium sp. NPDC049140 TaxID=3155647 RepID=UPI0034018AB5